MHRKIAVLAVAAVLAGCASRAPAEPGHQQALEALATERARADAAEAEVAAYREKMAHVDAMLAKERTAMKEAFIQHEKVAEKQRAVAKDALIQKEKAAETERAIRTKGLKRVALFGTRISMETGLFGRLKGIDVVPMKSDELSLVHDAYLGIVAAGQGFRESSTSCRRSRKTP